MVTLGDEGFNPSAGDGSYPYQTTEGVSFSQNLDIKNLDFGTYHVYPDAWSVDTKEWVTGWIRVHAEACKAAGKPCLFEEYGSKTDRVATVQPWQKTALQTDGTAGDLSWQVGDTISTGKTADDGYTIYQGTEDWKTLMEKHAAEAKSAA